MNKHIVQTNLKAVPNDKRHEFLEYLLLADDSKEMVEQYMHDGDLYSINFNGSVVGVVLFVPQSEKAVELKNIALDESIRGKGIGRVVIEEACKIYQQQGAAKMMVGTANSSIDNLAFYQKCGFRISSIKKDFFLSYPEPIFEFGIRAFDMIMFERNLQLPH